MSGIEEHYNALETLQQLIEEIESVQAEIDSVADDGIDGCDYEELKDVQEHRDELFEDIEELCEELGLDISQVIESD